MRKLRWRNIEKIKWRVRTEKKKRNYQERIMKREEENEKEGER